MKKEEKREKRGRGWMKKGWKERRWGKRMGKGGKNGVEEKKYDSKKWRRFGEGEETRRVGLGAVEGKEGNDGRIIVVRLERKK